MLHWQHIYLYWAQVYLILDEFIMGGEIQETSKKVSSHQLAMGFMYPATMPGLT